MLPADAQARIAKARAAKKALKLGLPLDTGPTCISAKAAPGGEGVAKKQPPVALPIDPTPHNKIGQMSGKSALQIGQSAVVLGPCLNPRVIFVAVEVDGSSPDGGLTKLRVKEVARLQGGPMRNVKFGRGARIRVVRERDGKLSIVGKYTRFGRWVPEYVRVAPPMGPAPEPLPDPPSGEGLDDGGDASPVLGKFMGTPAAELEDIRSLYPDAPSPSSSPVDAAGASVAQEAVSPGIMSTEMVERCEKVWAQAGLSDGCKPLDADATLATLFQPEYVKYTTPSGPVLDSPGITREGLAEHLGKIFGKPYPVVEHRSDCPRIIGPDGKEIERTKVYLSAEEQRHPSRPPPAKEGYGEL